MNKNNTKLTSQVVVQLLRIGLGSSNTFDFPQQVKWNEVMDIAAAQGILGIVFDGIHTLSNTPSKGMNLHLPIDMKMQWIGQVSYLEELYEQNWKVAQKIADWWSSENIHPLVLKGRAIAQYYPKPEHRYSCDLDVFVPNEVLCDRFQVPRAWDRACLLLEAKGIELVREVYKEVEFTFDGVYVECHCCITPYRGNETLKRFEQYLRNILTSSFKEYFPGTSLVCPPLVFTLMLFIEHALGDLLHGHLLLKHVVDWCVLRREAKKLELRDMVIQPRCREFGFDRFLELIDALADVVEDKREVDSLPAHYHEVFTSFFNVSSASKKAPKSWFARRLVLFFDIIRNRKMYSKFGYCSMEMFLMKSMWSHFFKRDIEVI